MNYISWMIYGLIIGLTMASLYHLGRVQGRYEASKRAWSIFLSWSERKDITVNTKPGTHSRYADLQLAKHLWWPFLKKEKGSTDEL